MATILVVDDDPQVLALTRQALVAAGHDVVGSLSASDAVHSCHTKRPSIAVVDWKLSGLDGIDLFADLLDRCPDLRGILITAYDLTPPSIDRALRARFTRFLHKPFSVDALVSAVAEEVALANRGRQESRSSGTSSRPPEHATNVSPLACLIGDSLAMERVRDRLMTFARYPHPVHLFGETGTGKELAAQAIHALSDRARGPFIAVNCPGVPSTLFESECFGHERGAYTGAHDRHPGWFERAHSGTLFLDEVGELPLENQAKLLRIVVDGSVTRLGGRERIRVDVRLITATNVDLKESVAAGRFRQDLRQRLTVFTLDLPPVRDRDDDVELLIDHFVDRFRGELDMPSSRLSLEARAHLRAYRWPGNVREIEHAVLQAMVVAEGRVIDPTHLPADVRGASLSTDPSEFIRFEGEGLEAYKARLIRIFERRSIEAALDDAHGNRTRAAQSLGIDRASLFKKMRRIGLAV